MVSPLLILLILHLILANDAHSNRSIKRDHLEDNIPNFVHQILLKKEHQERAMEDLRFKWREFFNTEDLNNDSIITLAERDTRIQIFVNIYRNSNKDTTYLIKTLRDAFDCTFFQFGGNETSISRDEFLNGIENAYMKDARDFRQQTRNCHKLFINCIDVNGDSLLTWREFKDFLSQYFEVGSDALKKDFIRWNPRVSVKEDVVASSIDINGDSRITWEEYRDFRGQCSKIADGAINKLINDFLDLDPHASVEEFVDAWTTFGADENVIDDKVQKEMDSGIFAKPKEPSSS